MNRETKEVKRFLILDTQGIYTQIYDEVYVPKEEVNKIRGKYAGYRIVEIPNTLGRAIEQLKQQP